MTDVTKVDLTQNPIAYEAMDSIPAANGTEMPYRTIVLIKDDSSAKNKMLAGQILSGIACTGFVAGVTAAAGGGMAAAGGHKEGNWFILGGAVTIVTAIFVGVFGCPLIGEGQKELKKNATNRLDA